MSPNYYAVIPAFVRYADIPPNAKLLYGEITALASKEGFCWASNKHFADLYGVNVTTVSEWVKALRDLGAITYEVIDQTKRKIYLSGKAEAPFGKSRSDPSEKAEHSIKDSITSNTSADARVIVEVRETPEGERAQRERRDTSYYAVYEVFKNPWPSSWKTHKAQIQAAKNLLAERGIEEVRDAVDWYRREKRKRGDDPFFPRVSSPWDLDTKWDVLYEISEKT